MKRVHSIASLPVIAIFTIAAWCIQPAVAASASPDARLQGVWQAVTFEKNGAKQPDEKANKLKFLISAERVYTWVDGQDVAESDYKTDAAAKPAAIEMKNEGHTTLGIYDIDGDQLRLCLIDGDKARPKEFRSDADATLITLKRVPFHGTTLFTMKADGTDVHQLPPHPVFTGAGSPNMSRDGTGLAWDAWRSVLGETFYPAHVLVGRGDGSGAKDLGKGAMPSWSPDGKQITYSCYGDDNGQGHGAWIMNADGSERQNIAPEGWTPRWSPKKNEIAYYASSRQAANNVNTVNIFVYDVAKASARPLLDKSYSMIWQGLAWSPDGKWICFLGDTPDGGKEIAAVSVEGEKKGFKVLMDSGTEPEISSVRPCLSWGGDGKQILVSMKGKDDKCQQLYLLDSDGKLPPKAVPGQDATRDYLDFGWSPDGKRIVYTSAVLETPKGDKAKDEKAPAATMSLSGGILIVAPSVSPPKK